MTCTARLLCIARAFDLAKIKPAATNSSTPSAHNELKNGTTKHSIDCSSPSPTVSLCARSYKKCRGLTVSTPTTSTALSAHSLSSILLLLSAPITLIGSLPLQPARRPLPRYRHILPSSSLDCPLIPSLKHQPLLSFPLPSSQPQPHPLRPPLSLLFTILVILGLELLFAPLPPAHTLLQPLHRPPPHTLSLLVLGLLQPSTCVMMRTSLAMWRITPFVSVILHDQRTSANERRQQVGSRG